MEFNSLPHPKVLDLRQTGGVQHRLSLLDCFYVAVHVSSVHVPMVLGVLHLSDHTSEFSFAGHSLCVEHPEFTVPPAASLEDAGSFGRFCRDPASCWNILYPTLTQDT